MVFATSASIWVQYKCFLNLAYVRFCPWCPTFLQLCVNFSNFGRSTSSIMIWRFLSLSSGILRIITSSVSTNRIVQRSILERISLKINLLAVRRGFRSFWLDRKYPLLCPYDPDRSAHPTFHWGSPIPLEPLLLFSFSRLAACDQASTKVSDSNVWILS